MSIERSDLELLPDPDLAVTDADAAVLLGLLWFDDVPTEEPEPEAEPPCFGRATATVPINRRIKVTIP